MTTLFSSPKECCGCAACRNICPRGAISMRQDAKGFAYPLINPELCIECGFCRKVCPFREEARPRKESPVEPKAYAAKHKSDEIRMNSSSGGMFTAFSDLALDWGGVIYGAAFDENFAVRHQRAETRQGRDRFRGSKYVQSDLDDVFSQVKQDLSGGREVLFTGTPCQVAGLKNFLNQSRVELSKFYSCDLVCHGVPSPKILHDYLVFMAGKYHSSVASLTFRYKPSGWRAQAMGIGFKNGKKYVASASTDFFGRLFRSNAILRDSCYRCPFASIDRIGDLTIADFWGIEKSMPDFEDEKGVSLLLVNTEKGEQLFREVGDTLVFRQSSVLDCLQTSLERPSVASPQTESFWTDYQRYGFDFVAKKYGRPGLKTTIKARIKKVLQSLGLLAPVKKLLRRSA